MEMLKIRNFVGLLLMLLVLGFTSVPLANAQSNSNSSATRADRERDDGTDWGWMGLLGLLGLAGLIPKKRAVDTTVRHDVR